MGFDMRRILRRYAADHQASLEAAETLERELKRFLVLCALHPGKPYGMAGPVDELWHTFLLFSRLYADFCDKVAGRFIHHEPADKDCPDEPQKLANGYADFRNDYEAVFGEPPPASVWPGITTARHEEEEPWWETAFPAVPGAGIL
jgi:hypothetical protein